MPARFNYRVAGIACAGERVLLERGPGDDFWVLPGGHPELGEPAAAALAREMSEELGAVVQVGRLLFTVENFYQYRGTAHHELALYFLMVLPAQLEKADEVPAREPGQEFRWHRLDELGPTRLLPSFLRTRLRTLPDVTEHVVHHDG
ncbi:MAG TPA: NUDIX domain-containing protein [Polyangia bacterium]|nr:NUDIX domain-containing protein [Polyangia bacterium]